MMRQGYETPQMYIAELKKEKPKEVSEICIQEWIGGDVHHRYMEFSMRNDVVMANVSELDANQLEKCISIWP